MTRTLRTTVIHCVMAALTLPALVVSDASVSPCTVADLRHRNVSATDALLEWTVAGCLKSSRLSFKVRAEHQRFLACQEKPDDSGTLDGDLVVSGETERLYYRLAHLRPFSEYQVEVIVADVENRTRATAILISTPSGIPETVPKASGRPRALQQALSIHWQPDEDCRRQNGIAHGYHVEIWGMDPWVANNESLRASHTAIAEKYEQNLLPYTTYKVRIFSQNDNGKWNPSKPLEYVARTEPTRPEPPSNIRLTPFETWVHLQWMPPYPPTGKVEKYIVHYGQRPSADRNATSPVAVWKKSYSVPATKGSCVNSDPAAVCWVVTDLEPDTDYVFEIRTWNINVSKPSDFSYALTVRTLPSSKKMKVDNDKSAVDDQVVVPSTSSTHLNATSTNDSGENRQPLVIVLCLVGAVLVAVVICVILVHKIKVNKLKMQFQQQQQQDSLRFSTMEDDNNCSLSSTYLSGPNTVTSFDGLLPLDSRHSSNFPTLNSSHIEDIQRRRLPDPPPRDADAKDRTVPVRSPEPVTDVSLFSNSSDDEQYVDVNMKPPLENTDVPGYLKPTFPSQAITSTPKRNTEPDVGAAVIPVESYETPRVLLRPTDPVGPDHSTLEGNTSVRTNKEEPMMISASVDI